MSSASTATSPPDDVLIPALHELRKNSPSLGIVKLHALLLSQHPEWAVSDKRFRKLLQKEGLGTIPGNADNKSNLGNESLPASRINPHLDVPSYCKKVEVKDFGQEKGKGLVAKGRIEEGEILWQEDPFAFAPDWDIFDLQQEGYACNHCGLPFPSGHPPLAVSCPASPICPAVFCSRLCLNRGIGTSHTYLCVGRNPPCKALLQFARKEEWRALLALAGAVSRILLAWSMNEEEAKKLRDQWASFATLDQEQRSKSLPDWEFVESRHRALWNRAHAVFLQALHPSDRAAQAKMKILQPRSLSADMEKDLFSHRGFLIGIGRVSLNLDSHGGLYLLHSHLNHSCAPNLAVKHPPAGINRTHSNSRIAIAARRDIQPGEELTVTYVNPSWSWQKRRKALKEWVITCECERCVEEMRNDDGKGDGEDRAVDDLERELRMSFGV